MIVAGENSVGFNRKGYPLGIVDDGDPFDRPEGSLENLVNMDYDVETGELQTRNSTVISDLLNGLTIPTGYTIMQGGLKVFSFNEPIDRPIILVFVKNTVEPADVRIYINAWYNPYADNTDPDNANHNKYETYIGGRTANQWYSEWTELTEVIELTDFDKYSPTQFQANGNLNATAGWYRGWFAWNATKWATGTTDLIRNESFVCIESYTFGNPATFIIQERDEYHFTKLGWNNNDKIWLVKYPILVSKAINTTVGATNLRMTFTPKGNKWLIKTNTSINCLIGEEGNLWIGFINKDTRKEVVGQKNFYKYVGWWIDYETPPISPKMDGIMNVVDGLSFNLIFDYRLGIRYQFTALPTVNDSKLTLFGSTVVLDDRQHICVFKQYKDLTAYTKRKYHIRAKPYHQYSRRIWGGEWYASNSTKLTEDPTGYVRTFYGLTADENGAYKYSPLYSCITGYESTEIEQYGNSNYPIGSNTLDSTIRYLALETIYNKATIGIYAQGRMFVSNDNTDEVRYSLLQREDVYALQNIQPIDASDKDKNTAIDLLSSNPVVFKNNSIHIIGIEGQAEVNWRLLEVKGRLGCPYPKSIIRTPYGLMFANNEGIWLLSDAGEPMSIIKRRRLQTYLAINNKGNIVSEWNSKHSEAWFYIGNNTLWVCKLSKEEKQIGWKTYNFNLTGTDWEIVDIITDEDNNFYIVTNKYLIRYMNDDETQTGKDANDTIIAFNWIENLNVLSTSNDKMHWIETILRIKPIGRTRGNDVIVNIYNEQDSIVRTKTIDVSIADNITIRNGLPNNQRALKVGMTGSLVGLERFKVQEAYSRFRLLKRPIKSSYMKVG